MTGTNKRRTDEVEADLYVPSYLPSLVFFNPVASSNESFSITALTHPLNHGLGEIGLDYHYNLSPPPVQQEVFRRQLRIAVRMGKPLTIHTREAEEDTERILKEEVPQEWKVAISPFFEPEFC